MLRTKQNSKNEIHLLENDEVQHTTILSAIFHNANSLHSRESEHLGKEKVKGNIKTNIIKENKWTVFLFVQRASCFHHSYVHKFIFDRELIKSCGCGGFSIVQKVP